MKIIILSPNADTLFTVEQYKKLESLGETLFVKEIKPFAEIEELFVEGDKVLALDPDFCDWKVPNEVIDKIPDLKAICLQTTSFSWIDIDHAKQKGIPVMNLRGFSTEAVAEWAFLMALNVARKIPLVAKDNWGQDYDKHKGIELRGKTTGIVGLGRIGSRIAELCEGFGMNVVYWSKKSKSEKYKHVELAELMKNSDLIFPVLAQNKETQGLITDALLRNMKPEAIFVSVVHHVYNHELLLELVKEGSIYGYAFEEDGGKVFDKYEGNVYASPALAWCTVDSLRKNAEQWVDSITKAVVANYETRVN